MSTTDFETGAVRSGDANHLRFDLIHPIAELVLAKTLAEGGTKYGDCNWERGMPVHDLLNHVKRHICLYLAGDRSEPHLPHAFCGLMFANVSDVLWPELNRPHLRGPGCTLTADVLAHQEAGDAERQRLREEGAFDLLGDWKATDIPEVNQLLSIRRIPYEGRDPAKDDYPECVAVSKETTYRSTIDLINSRYVQMVGRGTRKEAEKEPRAFCSIGRPNCAGTGRTMVVETDKPVTYIAGPMTGLPDHNFHAFHEAAETLRSLGYPVHSPHDSGSNPSESYETCLRRAINILLQCSQVAMLQGWQDSKGAQLEHLIAKRLGMNIVNYMDLIGATTPQEVHQF